MHISNEEIVELIEKVEPKIKKSLYQTTWNQREDLEQSIKLKIIESIKNIEDDNYLGFFDFKKQFD